MKHRIHMWRDDHRRFLTTGAGNITIEPGETCIVIVADRLTPGLLALVEAEQREEERGE